MKVENHHGKSSDVMWAVYEQENQAKTDAKKDTRKYMCYVGHGKFMVILQMDLKKR